MYLSHGQMTEIIIIINNLVILIFCIFFQEIKSIRESRETCGCSCKDECKPNTCECILNDIGMYPYILIFMDEMLRLVLLQNVKRKEMDFPAVVGLGAATLMAEECLIALRSPCITSTQSCLSSLFYDLFYCRICFVI